MTKRKKQIEITGFTKASTLLPKDKKQDSKTTPSKQYEGTKTRSSTKTHAQSPDNHSVRSKNDEILETDQTQDSFRTKNLNDTDFFNSTVDDQELDFHNNEPRIIMNKTMEENDRTNLHNSNDTINVSAWERKMDTTQNEISMSKEVTEQVAPTTTLDSQTVFDSPNSPQKTTKVYGTSMWCAARAFCQNVNEPATYDYWCTMCQFSGHLECVTIPSDEDMSQCICIYCQPKEQKNTLISNNQSLMQTDTSAILHEDSFDTWNINNENEIQALNKILDSNNHNDRDKQIQFFASLDKTNNSIDDSILHALALTTGAQIKATHIHEDKLSAFII
jgi:hypothetical protein